MASKKRHITNEAELLKAMRSLGYCFPTNEFEQKISLKFQAPLDMEAMVKKIDPKEIWNSENPRMYSKSKNKEVDSEDSFIEEWGIAAKGNANISDEIMAKIIKNQKEKKNDGGNSKS